MPEVLPGSDQRRKDCSCKRPGVFKHTHRGRLPELRPRTTSLSAMAIKPKFTHADVQKRLDAFLAMVKKKQIARMQRLGEMCLIEARNNKGYMMQTGALLSSTGYMIFVDGVALHSQFDAASGAESNAAQNGIKAGQALAEKVGKNTKGVALVVVAGMNYAAYVEAKGYNVLSSAEHLAQRELPRMLEKLISNIRAAAE